MLRGAKREPLSLLPKFTSCILCINSVILSTICNLNQISTCQRAFGLFFAACYLCVLMCVISRTPCFSVRLGWGMVECNSFSKFPRLWHALCSFNHLTNTKSPKMKPHGLDTWQIYLSLGVLDVFHCYLLST